LLETADAGGRQNALLVAEQFAFEQIFLKAAQLTFTKLCLARKLL
jgi:hypothetical protein